MINEATMDQSSSSSSMNSHGSRRGGSQRSTTAAPTTTTSPTRTLLTNTRTAPRPLRRGGLDNSSSGKATTVAELASNNDVHRYSSHYFPGEESIVLQYPNQWHDRDETINGGNSIGADRFPRFPPPPTYPPPSGGAGTAVVTNNHPSLLGRTLENELVVESGRESVDRSGANGNRASGNGGDAAAKIMRNGENRNGMVVNNNVMGGPSSAVVTVNRKLGPEHPDAIDTTSSRIMDATNVINSKTLGGKGSNNGATTTSVADTRTAPASSRLYCHHTLGFQQRRAAQKYHRHSANIDNDSDDDEVEVVESGNGRPVADNGEDEEGFAAGDQWPHRLLEDGASRRSANRNKLFSSNDNSNNSVIREPSLADCRSGTASQSHSKQGRTTKKTNSKNNTCGLINGLATATMGGRGSHIQAHHSNEGGYDGNSAQNSQWQRSNIAATMERYEPSTSSSSMSSFTSSNHPATTPPCHHQDYSYAYYEPGAPMRHSNMYSPGAGPSTTAPPPNSIRALLAKGSRNNSFGSPSSSGSSRHASSTSCTPRYGPHENIYEEIGSDGRVRLVTAITTGHQHHQSMFSLDPASVEEEFRRVQNRHERTLEELNLSVEAMLMPSHEDTVPVIRQQSGGSGHAADLDGGQAPESNNDEMDFQLRSMVGEDEVIGVSGNGLGDNESAVGSSSHTNGDLDSGFSGSSSGTSYVGSLRYQRTASALSNCCPSAMATVSSRTTHPNELQCRYTSGPSAATTAGFPARLSTMYTSSRNHNFHTNAAFSDSFHGKPLPFQRSAEDPGPSRAHIVNLRANHMYSNCIAEAVALGVQGGEVKPGGRLSSFLSRKGWRLPGFNSMTSVNKADTIMGTNLAIAGSGTGAATNALCFGRHPSP